MFTEHFFDSRWLSGLAGGKGKRKPELIMVILLDKIFDRVKAKSGYTDHDLHLYPKFSKRFLIMGDDSNEIKKFFNKKLINFFEEHQIQHIESNGEALMIYNYLHIAPSQEVENMLNFTVELLEQMNMTGADS